VRSAVDAKLARNEDPKGPTTESRSSLVERLEEALRCAVHLVLDLMRHAVGVPIDHATSSYPRASFVLHPRGEGGSV
jgi:hypothetical protein